MRLASFALLLGILSCHLLFEFVTQWWIGVLLFTFMIIVGLIRSRYRIPMFWLIFGFISMWWHISSILTQHLPMELENQPVVIVGKMVSFPRNEAEYRQGDFLISQLHFDGKIQPFQGIVRLTWHFSPQAIVNFPEWTPQQTWQFTARLHSVHEVINFDIFDYSNFLFQQRIRAVGRIERATLPQLLTSAPHIHIDRWRYQLMLKINKLQIENPLRGIIIALTLGEGQGISQPHWQLFRNTGIIHLVVISGSHITLIAWLIFSLVDKIWRYTGRLVLWLPAPQIAAFVSLLGALGYALLAGFSIPTQRAVIMVAVVIINKLLARQTRTSDLIATALFFVLLYDPLAILSNGFWLSFLAVAAIAWALHGRTPPQRWLLKLNYQFLTTQYAVFTVLFPILLLYYSTFPLNSFLANFIAIPWFNLVIVPLVLTGAGLTAFFPTLANNCFEFATIILHGCLSVLDWLAQNHWSVKIIAPPTLITLTLASLGIAILLLPRGFPSRWLGYILLFPIFFSPPAKPIKGEIWFTLFDIGQGLAAMIQTQNYTLIYDTGDKKGNTTMVERVILPYLQARKIYQIDMLMISHVDADHSSGIDVLEKNVQIDQIVSSDSIKNNGLCRAGQHWTWDAVEFKVLHPETVENYSSNNRSCVLKIQTGEHGILLAGDIENIVEHRLTRHYPYDLKSEILVVPHHGSKTSSSESFVRVVEPQYALISSGYLNRFKHPKAEVVQRYQLHGVKLLNTAEVGAITFKITAQQISAPRLARVERHRYWHR